MLPRWFLGKSPRRCKAQQPPHKANPQPQTTRIGEWKGGDPRSATFLPPTRISNPRQQPGRYGSWPLGAVKTFCARRQSTVWTGQQNLHNCLDLERQRKRGSRSCTQDPPTNLYLLGVGGGGLRIGCQQMLSFPAPLQKINKH